ncbi:MAG: hypothetical protein Q8T11_15380 [Elusimicrobiota bacterium]|nr:hypothetical protein [Elusimicrobiota bacterium]
MRAACLSAVCLGWLIPCAAAGEKWEWPGDAEKRPLRDEIDEAGPSHPWAGEYYEGDGLGHNLSLTLSPKGTFILESSGCTGSSPTERGRVRRIGDTLRFEGTKSYWLADKDFHVVTWGARAYLLREGELVRFANYVNRGWEPSYGRRGHFMMRRGAGLKLATGRPKVPASIEPLILDRVVDASVISVGRPISNSTEPWPVGGIKTLVELDAGSRDGLSAGLELPLRGGADGEATVVSTKERTSTAELVSTTTPNIGWRVSTRYDDRRDLPPPDRPFRIKAVGSSPRDYPPLNEALHIWTGEVPFAGAEAHGITVIEVGRVHVELTSRDLLSDKFIAARFEEAAAGLGANARRMTMYYYPELKDERPGPWPVVMDIPVYRVEHHGRPLGPLDFASSCREGGCSYWGQTVAGLRVNSTRYAKEIEKAFKESRCALLRLSRGQCDGWNELKVQDLDARQLAAFRDLWDLMENRGLVARHEPQYERKWRDPLEREAETRLARVRSADPKAYDEYLMYRDERNAGYDSRRPEVPVGPIPVKRKPL